MDKQVDKKKTAPSCWPKMSVLKFYWTCVDVI